MMAVVFDQEFYYIRSVAIALDLPPNIASALADHQFPADAFGYLSEQEWEPILEGMDVSARKVTERIAAWKEEMGIVGQSVIPQLKQCYYVVESEEQPNEMLGQEHQHLAIAEKARIKSEDGKSIEKNNHAIHVSTIGNPAVKDGEQEPLSVIVATQASGIDGQSEQVPQDSSVDNPDIAAVKLNQQDGREESGRVFDFLGTPSTGKVPGEKNGQEQLSVYVVTHVGEEIGKDAQFIRESSLTNADVVAIVEDVPEIQNLCETTETESDRILEATANEDPATGPVETRHIQFSGISEQSGGQSNNNGRILKTLSSMERAGPSGMNSSVISSKQCLGSENVQPCSIFTPKMLEELLAKSECGAFILESAKNGVLSKDSQKDLASIIAAYHIRTCSTEPNIRKRKLPKVILENYAKCISLLFSKEGSEMITYYIPAAPPERRNPGGAIYQAYKRLKSASKKRETREQDHAKQILPNATSDVQDDPRVQHACMWLSINSTPWDIVLQMWIVSGKSRIRDLNKLKSDEILTKHPLYGKELGYQLVDEDYRMLGHAEGIRGWPHFVSVLRPCFVMKVKSESSLAILEHLNRAESSEDAIVCCTLMLLTCCVPPCKLTKNFKPAILTAQEDILIFAAGLDVARQSIRKLEQSYNEQRISPHPKIVAIGANYKSMTGEFYVIYKQMEYKLESLTRAVDVLVKMCNVLKLPFSKVSKLVWYTVEEILYKIAAPAQYKDIETIKKLFL